MTGQAHWHPIRLLSWNILHGGGPNRMPEIALWIIGQSPDVVVLTEFRRSVGGQIVGVLADFGLKHSVSTRPGPGENGVLIASRMPLAVSVAQPEGAPFRGRWLGVTLEESGMGVLGVHVPDDTRPTDKSLFWRELVNFARARPPGDWVVAGDFNTGRHRLDEEGETFGATALLGAFCTAGFDDAWRTKHPERREYSWVSRTGSGFRMDHAFVSEGLRARVSSVSYAHDVRERRLSDHSALMLELA